MIKLYGKNGRSFRCAWMLEEANVTYERVPIKYGTDTSTPEFLAVNPNGKIPVLDDDGLVIFESLAINIHVARQYGGDLWPEESNDQTRTIQWMAWALGELEGPHDASNKSGTPIDSIKLERSLDALRHVLGSSAYLLGDRFTVADLNTAAILLRPSYAKIAKADSQIGSWFNRCINREPLLRVTSPIKKTGDGS